MYFPLTLTMLESGQDLGLTRGLWKTERWRQLVREWTGSRTGMTRVTEGCGRQTEVEAAGQRVGRM